VDLGSVDTHSTDYRPISSPLHSSDGPSRSRNFLFCVAIHAKNVVRLVLSRPPHGPKVRIDVLPHHLACRRYFKEAPKHTFIDQRVSIRQPLRVGDAIAVESLGVRILVLPNDLVRGGIDLDHSRRRKGLVQARGAVIEYQNVAT
jgi:hypothetical protein